MADVPKDLLNQIKEFEDVFTVDQQKLKEVVAHFVKELEKGASLPIGGLTTTTIFSYNTD
jgi:hexokinase